MLKNPPFLIMFVLPFLVVLGVATYQVVYWSGAKEASVVIESISTSKAEAFMPTDVRRATVTEINVTFTDDLGETRQIQQLSPFTKYFFDFGDTLTVRYFNETGFEGTIWSFSIKFYYVIVIGGYLVLGGAMVFVSSLKTKKRKRY